MASISERGNQIYSGTLTETNPNGLFFSRLENTGQIYDSLKELTAINPVVNEIFQNANYWRLDQPEPLLPLSALTYLLDPITTNGHIIISNLRSFMYTQVVKGYKASRKINSEEPIGSNLPDAGHNYFLNPSRAADLSLYMAHEMKSSAYRLLYDLPEFRRRYQPDILKTPPQRIQTPENAFYHDQGFRFNLPVPNFNLYNEAIDIPYLTADEELYCTLMLRQENIDTEPYLLYLYRSNTAYVINVVNQFLDRGVERDELIQEGKEGLLRGISKYDPDFINPDTGKPYRLKTYADHWIRQHIRRAIATYGRTIRLPMTRIQQISEVYDALKKMGPKNSKKLTNQQIAEFLNIPETEVANRFIQSRDICSLDTPVYAGEDTDRYDMLADPNQNTESTVALAESISQLLQVMNQYLSPRKIQILELRYGLNGYHEHTLRQAGEVMGVSRERIRQLQAEAEAELRQELPHDTYLNLD